MTLRKLTVPDLGDFEGIDVIELLVSVGDHIDINTPIVTVESDKSSMDIPSDLAGEIKEIVVKEGDKISAGDHLLTLDSTETIEIIETTDTSVLTAETPPSEGQKSDYDVVVIGSGPGGYTAAFRAADLGLNVLLIERYATIGGVCLNVGCIPSKALLHIAKVIDEAKQVQDFGVTFNKPKLQINKIKAWKDSVVEQLTSGLTVLAKQRKVTVLQGHAQFTNSHELKVENGEVLSKISFQQAIIATGSKVIKIPGIPYDDKRIIDSTGALQLDNVPKKLLVIGGGIIGLEMATVYHELGAHITLVEMMDSLIPGCDKDLVRPLQQRLQKKYENIFLKTKVSKIEAIKKGLQVHFEGVNVPAKQIFDKVLVAVGRTPNGKQLGLEKAQVKVSDSGFIEVDNQQRTNQQHIFAIGDIVGQPMLAHKAVHEAKVAAEVCAGEKSYFDARVIPSVAYTDPEVAWVGLTETQAKLEGITYGKGAFPWAASGRSLSLGRKEGLSKILFDTETNQVLGVGIVGPNAGDLIAEAGLAIEMGCDAEDLGLTIHPHPTLSETIAMAAEVYTGTITDLYIAKK